MKTITIRLKGPNALERLLLLVKGQTGPVSKYFKEQGK